MKKNKIYQLSFGRDGSSGYTYNYFSSNSGAEQKIKELWPHLEPSKERPNFWEGYDKNQSFSPHWGRIIEHILY